MSENKYDKENVFAKIIRGEIVSERVGENDNFIAIRDHAPHAPVHLLIIPKAQFSNLEQVDLNDDKFMAGLLRFARQMARQEGITSNYKLLMNVGSQIQQVQHLHLHLLGGWAEKDIPQ